MRRDTNDIKKVYTAKSESRFTVYESKSMVKQEWYTDLLEKSSLKGIARGTQLRSEAKDRRSFSNLTLQQGLAKKVNITVDLNVKPGIIISVDSLKGII